MNIRQAKKILKQASKGTKYRKSTYNKACTTYLRHLRKHNPKAYAGWYYSPTLGGITHVRRQIR